MTRVYHLIQILSINNEKKVAEDTCLIQFNIVHAKGGELPSAQDLANSNPAIFLD